ncbi:MAG TPA: low-complexity tail membrane protein [Crinalium sp.]|jgi:hypothetical protein
MRSFRSDPYLWIHLAGVAALPILLEICFLGLAAGEPFLPVGIELLLIAALGIAPVLWMQWQRPFCIFSLLLVALKPGQLTVEQRKILRLFKTQENRAIAILTPIILVWVLWQLYRFAPIASDITPFHSRGLGLLVAAIAFMGSNLFAQVPASIVPVLFTSESKFEGIEPYPVEKVGREFSLLGIPVKRILPDFIVEEKPSRVAATTAIATPKESDVAELDEDFETEPESSIPAAVTTVEAAAIEVEQVSEVEAPLSAAEATKDVDEFATLSEAEVAAPASETEDWGEEVEVEAIAESDVSDSDRESVETEAPHLEASTASVEDIVAGLAAEETSDATPAIETSDESFSEDSADSSSQVDDIS